MDELAKAGMPNQNAPQSIASDTNIQSSQSEVKAPAHVDAKTELDKTFTQDDVNRIAGRVREEARREAYERARQEAQFSPQVSQSTTQSPSAVTDEQIERIIDSKVKERAELEYGKKIASDFLQKLERGRTKYSDFDDTVSQLNLASVPHVIHWANNLENAEEVVYDLGRHPEKYANVLMLATTSPPLAQQALKRLSDSINQNQKAAAEPRANEPLSQLIPANAGTDNGKMVVRDLRKQPWLRG